MKIQSRHFLGPMQNLAVTNASENMEVIVEHIPDMSVSYRILTKSKKWLKGNVLQFKFLHVKYRIFGLLTSY